MRPLVSAAELARLVGDGSVVVADVRWYLDGRDGRAAYEAGHVPGAVFVDLDTALAAPGRGPGRHPLPDPRVFSAAMAAVGIGDDTTVVAYDDAGGSVAARLWWMLRVTGREAAVLDGGLAAWSGPLETGPAPARPPGSFSVRPWPTGEVVDAAGVERSLRAGAVVLDARAPERFRGEVEPVDARPGHVPGARNAPWAANLDPATKRFLPGAELRARYEALGVRDGADVVCYCGSGVTACHDVLALELAGFRARLYEGSWSDWSADPARPVATG